MILPKIPSQLIRIALKDEAKAHRSPRYKVDMDGWHVPNSQCAICLAGGVMAFSLGADINQRLIPENFQENIDQLHALESLRAGDMKIAFRYLGVSDRPIGFSHCELEIHVDITCYETSRLQFRKDMFKLADRLKASGY